MLALNLASPQFHGTTNSYDDRDKGNDASTSLHVILISSKRRCTSMEQYNTNLFVTLLDWGTKYTTDGIYLEVASLLLLSYRQPVW